MYHRIVAAARVALAGLVVVTTVGPALPVYGHRAVSSASNQPVLDCGLQGSPGVAIDSPAALPDPVVSGGTDNQLGARRAPSDDRDNATPTSWHIRADQTAQQVTDTINKGYRLVDIHVDATWPSYRFTTAYVANSGTYQKSWWWYYDADGDTLSDALSNNNARLISLKAHDLRFPDQSPCRAGSHHSQRVLPAAHGVQHPTVRWNADTASHREVSLASCFTPLASTQRLLGPDSTSIRVKRFPIVS